MTSSDNSSPHEISHPHCEECSSCMVVLSAKWVCFSCLQWEGWKSNNKVMKTETVKNIFKNTPFQDVT